MEDLGATRALQHRDGLERGDRDLLGRRVAEIDVLELDRGRPTRNIERARPLLDHGTQVGHLEDTVERHEGGHHVDLDVRERREWTVKACEVQRERDDRADQQRALRRLVSADAIHESCRQRGGEQQRRHEDPAVHRLGDANVADSASSTIEDARL